MMEESKTKGNGGNLVEAYGLKKWFPVQRTFVENLLTRDKQFVRAVDGVTVENSRLDFHVIDGKLGLFGSTNWSRPAMCWRQQSVPLVSLRLTVPGP